MVYNVIKFHNDICKNGIFFQKRLLWDKNGGGENK